MSDALKLGASAAYLQEEDDSLIAIDGYALAGGLVWSFMPNTSLHLQLQYTDGTLTAKDSDIKAEIGNDDYDITNFSAGTGLFVNF